MFRTGLSIETASRFSGCQGLGVREEYREIANGHRVSFLGDVNDLELDSGD